MNIEITYSWRQENSSGTLVYPDEHYIDYGNRRSVNGMFNDGDFSSEQEALDAYIKYYSNWAGGGDKLVLIKLYKGEK